MSKFAELQESWRGKWPAALALWSRYTKLGEPHWCLDHDAEKAEGLASSFAMIRLDDKAVVISLAQVAEHGLENFPLEVMGHEIGHHVYCPADLADQGRMIARMRHALPTMEEQAGFVANLYADMLINDKLQRSSRLDMAGVYRTLGGGSKDRTWNLYMRIYEILWSLPQGALADREVAAPMEGDARLGARVARTYAREWLEGSGRFAALFFPYLMKDRGEGIKAVLKNCTAAAEGAPDGLAEIEDGEIEGAVHPALDEGADGDEGAGAGKAGEPDLRGSDKPMRRYREPWEYGEIMKSLGLSLDENEAAIRYYRERAMPHLIPFPSRVIPESVEPLPEGLEVWDAGSPLEEVDWLESVLKSPRIVPGMTTARRVYGTTEGALPKTEPVDLYLGIDCSGSMVNPQRQISYPVLAGAILALSALRSGASVMVTLSGEPGLSISTDGFVRDEHAVLQILTGYLGTGFAFGIQRLEEGFASRKPDARPAHIVVVTDQDIFRMLDSGTKTTTGRRIAKDALEKAKGGGTFVLHMPGNWKAPETERMEEDGWNVSRIQSWEDIVAFARDFSRAKWGAAEEPAASRGERA